MALHCVLVDLFNREINGHSAGPNKNAVLIIRAFTSVNGDLRQIQWFHTDRGREFKNQKMDELLKTFEIKRSLSMKGCPYDNAVTEATYKIMKIEFVNQMNFQSIPHLELELYDYVNWFNEHRIHGTLGDLTPVQYRHAALKKSYLIYCRQSTIKRMNEGRKEPERLQQESTTNEKSVYPPRKDKHSKRKQTRGIRKFGSHIPHPHYTFIIDYKAINS